MPSTTPQHQNRWGHRARLGRVGTALVLALTVVWVAVAPSAAAPSVAAPSVAAVPGTTAPQAPAPAAPGPTTPSVSSTAHVQNLGWLPPVSDGATAGTTGRSLDLQALRLSTTAPDTVIRYRAHVATIGWQAWRSSSETAGTTGRSLAVEALQVTLTGAGAARHGIEYRAHVAGLGWQPWRTEGAVAGTTGQGRSIEAVQVRLTTRPSATVTAHVQNLGWLPPVSDGATAGTTGRSLDLQALRLSTTAPDTVIRYRAHVATIGWQAWRSSSETAGTTGRSLAVEALQVTLTGAGAARHGIEYRAHVAGLGWQPWRTEGAVAGTTGQGRSIEAVQVRLMPKVRLAVTADTGMDRAAAGVFAGMGARRTDLNLIVGDLSYQSVGREPAYCSFVNSRVPGPTLVVAGNHEDTLTRNGTIENFARCLPDRVGVTGTYGKDYWVDSGPVRAILISPAIPLSTGTRTYRSGSPEAAWLTSVIRQARADGQWVVVGMHKPCLTVGTHGCESSRDLTDLMVRERVDLVLSGHDHNYSRSHQLTGTTRTPVVVDRDGQYLKGAGTVFAVVGNGGHEARPVRAKTDIWAAANGTNSPGGFVYGFASIDATAAQLTYSLVRTSGGQLTDTFTVSRP